MQFVKTEKGHGKLTRAFAVLLSLLIIVSMMYVGKVGTIEASAETISAGTDVYLAFLDTDDNNNNPIGWYDDDCEVGVWAWKGTDSGTFYRLYQVAGTKTDDNKISNGVYKFTPTSDIDSFLLRRFTGTDSQFSLTDGANDWSHIINGNGSEDATNKSHDFSVSGFSSTNNCFYFHGSDKNGNKIVEPKLTNEMWFTNGLVPPTVSLSQKGSGYGNKTYGNDTNPVTTDFYDTTNSTYHYNDVKLYPVKASFYDYLSDWECENGWRTNTTDYESSRTYLHRIPFTKFNSYISSLTGGEEGTWLYPLYFGNFTSPWTDFSGYPYGSLIDKFIYPKNAAIANGFYGYDDTSTNSEKGHLRHENFIANYTGTDNTNSRNKLNNFSIFANDSEPLHYLTKPNDETKSYSASVQGLVEDELHGGNMYMKSTTSQSVPSPYFQANEYTNVVNTEFPMRVVESTTTETENNVSVSYTKYQFDSKGRESGNPDIVYFNYNNLGEPTAINYTNEINMQVIDAYKSLGGNTDVTSGDFAVDGNHRGFFPFDTGNSSGNKIAYDYGFGMRLDIDFNLTKDGYIVGKDSNGKLTETNLPMEFEFKGDDDVWVFYDDKLVLDLGGDHGNASGKINFAINNVKNNNDAPQSAIIDTGVVSLAPTVAYGGKNYATCVANNGTKYTSPINSKFDDTDYTTSEKTEYDVTKNHTLTVFYMERGMVESNLNISFSISPIGNKLTTDKTVDTSLITNEGVKSRVEEYLAESSCKEQFKFTVDDQTASNKTYEKGDTTETYNSESGISLKNGESFKFVDQIVDESTVTINETISDSCKYKYQTVYTVVDNFMKSNNDKDSTVDTGYTVKDKVAAETTSNNGGGSVSFEFNTNSSVTTRRKYNDFTVSATNKIKVGTVNLKKEITNSLRDDTVFTFNVSTKLPHENNFTNYGTITCKANDNTGTNIERLPIGTQVKFTEVSNSNYTDKTNEIILTVEESIVSGTYKNEKKPIENSTTVTIKKTVNNQTPTSDEAGLFSFKMQEVDSSGTAKQGNDYYTIATLNTSVANLGKAVFDSEGSFTRLKFTGEETRYFKINEEDFPDSNSLYDKFTKDGSVYYVKCVATVNNGTISIAKYYCKSLNIPSSDTGWTEWTDGTELTFNNLKDTTGKIIFKKVGSDTGRPALSGAVFALYKSSDIEDGKPKSGVTAVDTATSQNNGLVTFNSVEPGNYYIVETKAPTGYELYGKLIGVMTLSNGVTTISDSTAITVTAGFTACGADYEVVNTKSTELPQTGGIGVVIMIVGGLALIGLGIYLLKSDKKKEDTK